MKNWVLFFALCFALMSAACANKGQTAFEDTGKKMDQGTQTTGDKIDEGLNRAGEEIEKGFDQAGKEMKDATQ
ncbi:MAG: hypothetical protein JW902_11000 [Syntrophaceae bacterium]|nr:hypothetical protein [Syntrophaceae bacterium]